ncbi:hypothetical protein DFH07DRAFT_171843 [Mycena maculata]|uniref:Uncharacterized protein n=1 Tax=Mycena maculata TaxID=230809 RepID=A0AAD7NRP6_9AGAR|nr:hypothetical protein DFH07DRAFT_171843 [Mycena maculata]
MTTAFSDGPPFTEAFSQQFASVGQTSVATTSFPTPTTILVTETTVVTATSSGGIAPTPTSPPPKGQNSGLSIGAITGLSLGIGLLVGLVAAMLIIFARRRRAPKNIQSRGTDQGEALLGYQDKEKQPTLYDPAPQPIPHARVVEWVQRTRAVSISTIASSFFPTIADSETTVARSQSIGGMSSRSTYSQMSALRAENNYPEFEGPSRPPDLYKINE